MYKDPNEHRERDRAIREMRDEKLKEYKPEPHVLVVLLLLLILAFFLTHLLTLDGVSSLP